MATTNISTEIVSITGVTAHAASDEFIVSAQKFVAASIPKDLLRWAASETVPATHGGDNDPQQVTIPTGTDSIISVRRDSYVAQEVGIEDRGFIASSNSLLLATNTFPKYFAADANRIIVKPDPDSTYKIYVTYVDYSNIGDTSDLINAVIYHACSSELSKLSTAELPTVSIAAVPPDVPSLATVGFTETNALSISVTSPTAISLTSVTFTSLDSDIDASLPTYTTAVVAAGGVYGSSTAPAYTKPTLTTPVSFEDFFSGTEDLNPFGDSDPGVLSISAVAPATPTAPTISYSNAFVGDSISVAQDAITGAVDGYTGETDTSMAGTAAGTGSSATGSTGSGASGYTAPSVEGSAVTKGLLAMTDGTVDTDADQIDYDKWWDILAEFIENEEDTELASVQIQKINSYISAFQAEVQSASAAMQATIEDARQSTQASIATAGDATRASIATGGDATRASIATHQADTTIKGAGISSLTSAKVAQMQQSTSASISKMQQSTSAAIQKMQLSTNINIQNAAKTLEASMQDYTLELQKYQADVGKYQAEVSDELQEYTQKLSRYQLEVNTAFQAWQKTESDRLSQYQTDIQSEVNEFNKENVSFQANIQEAVQEIQVANQVNIAKAQGELQLNIDNENRSQQRQLQNGINDMQAIVADNGRKISQYQAEASHYATQVNQYVQNYTSRLQKDMQDTQATIANNDDLVAKYQSELQQYTSEVQAETAEYQNKIQKQQALSKEADKYYQWAKLEVTTYIQNNSKMIAATMAGRSQSAQA